MDTTRRKQITSVTLTPELRAQIEQEAGRQGRSLTGRIEVFCRQGLEAGQTADMTSIEIAVRAAGLSEKTAARIVAALRGW